MDRAGDPFITLAGAPADDFANLQPRSVSATPGARSLAFGLPPVVARFHGFDLLDQPVLADLPMYPGQLMVARTALPLRREMIGRDVVVLFDGGDPKAPIIIGIIEPIARAESPFSPDRGITVHADGERHVIEAEREIVLRCGDASITLTRAGKVIIKGNYILSRSTGYNKIKGAAIDIN